MSKKKKNKGNSMYHHNDHGTTGASTYVECEHKGTVPVMIGGFPLHLGAQSDLSEELLSSADILLPLNGSLPWSYKQKLKFGDTITMAVCEMQDRGGVPDNWGDFVDSVAAAMRSGKRVVAWCFGSHGRSGTLGASLISRMEPDTADPIAAIRERHCKKAVESLAQATAVFALRGQSLPEPYVAELATKASSFGFASATGAGGSLRLSDNSGYGVRPGIEGKTVTGPYRGRDFYHHAACRCSACKKNLSEGKNYNESFWFRFPCTCPVVACTIDRKMYANELKDSPTAKVPAQPQYTDYTMSEGHLVPAIHCLCDMCIARQADTAKDHDPTNPQCNCIWCIITWKLEQRGDLYKMKGHPYDCICESCWWTTEGHNHGCLCGECRWLNCESPELEQYRRPKAKALIATNSDVYPKEK